MTIKHLSIGLALAYLFTFLAPGIAHTGTTIYPGPFTLSLLMLTMLILSGPSFVILAILNMEKRVTCGLLLVVAGLVHAAIGYLATPSTQLHLLEQSMYESQAYDEEHLLAQLHSSSSDAGVKANAALRLYQNHLRSHLIWETRGATVPFSSGWYWPVIAFAWAAVFAGLAWRLPTRIGRSPA